MLEIEHLVRSSFVILFVALNFCIAQSHPNLKIDSLLNIGIKKIVLAGLYERKKYFYYLIQSYENIPLGNIYLAATEIAKSVDYEEELNENYLDSLLTLAKIKTDVLLKIDDENLWYHYYEALIYGYQAYYSALTSNLVSAFADGVLSLQNFQKCLEIDPKFKKLLSLWELIIIGRVHK